MLSYPYFSILAVIKVDKMNPCTICFEDAPKRPVACTCCRQTIGCRYCVKKWFFTTNMSHLDQRTPYPIGTTDRNHKRCPYDLMFFLTLMINFSFADYVELIGGIK